MFYRTTTTTIVFGAVPNGTAVRMYDDEPAAHRGFLDSKDHVRATFGGNSTSASVVLERATYGDFRDTERLASFTIQKGGTRNAAPIESTVYHAQIAEPSAPVPKVEKHIEPAKPKLYSIKTKQYYLRSEWDSYFETEEQAREALSKLMEAESARLARETGDPRCEYELLFDRKDCIDNVEIYKNHNKVATVRK